MCRPDEIAHFAASDVGVKRSHNQDAYGVALALTDTAWTQRGHFFVVADGMGSHAVGELASKLAVDAIGQTYGKLQDVDVETALRRAIVDANQTIHEKGEQNPEFRGMGTTATALVLLPEGASIGHVGDSRCYRIDATTIEQLSFDHSLQWELARRQNVSPEKLRSVPSNIIIRSLGPEAEVKVDVNGPYPYKRGDRFLICSDGLTGPVQDKELWAVVSHLPGDEACRFLVDLANLRGGLDNITVVLVQVGDPDKEPPESERRGPEFRERLWKLVQKVSLTGWLLTVGILLSLLAFGLRSAGLSGGRPIVSLAAMVLVAGLSLWYRDVRRRREARKQPPKPPPPVYRSKRCELDSHLIENLANVVKHLREMATEENWNVDWSVLREKNDLAAKCFREEDLGGAFREYGRSVSILSAALRERRHKHEVLMPKFDQGKT